MNDYELLIVELTQTIDNLPDADDSDISELISNAFLALEEAKELAEERA